MALDRSWFNALVDDDGSGMTGSVWDKADIKNLLDSVDSEIARIDSETKGVVCVLRNAAEQPWGPNTWASVPFTEEVHDPLNIHSPGDYYIYPPATGTYLVDAYVMWPPSSEGARGITLLYGGAWPYGNLFDKAFDGGSGIGITSRLSMIVPLTYGAGPIALQLWQNTAASQFIPARAIYFSLARV